MSAPTECSPRGEWTAKSYTVERYAAGGYFVMEAQCTVVGCACRRNVAGPYTTREQAEARAVELRKRAAERHQGGSMTDDLTRVYELVEMMARQLTATVELLAQAHTQLHAELAEVRDGMIELDHKLADVQRFAAKANRYGIVTREMVLDHGETIGALDDAVTVLRNDYRGEAA